MPGIAHVHRVAASAQGPAVGEYLLTAAGIDIIDAALSTMQHDFLAVGLEVLTIDVLGHPAPGLVAADDVDEPFPMSAQADGGYHQVCLATPPVLHVRVVVENAAGICPLGVAGSDCLGGRQRARRADARRQDGRCRSGIADKLPSRNFLAHRIVPFHWRAPPSHLVLCPAITCRSRNARPSGATPRRRRRTRLPPDSNIRHAGTSAAGTRPVPPLTQRAKLVDKEPGRR